MAYPTTIFWGKEKYNLSIHDLPMLSPELVCLDKWETMQIFQLYTMKIAVQDQIGPHV